MTSIKVIKSKAHILRQIAGSAKRSGETSVEIRPSKSGDISMVCLSEAGIYIESVIPGKCDGHAYIRINELCQCLDSIAGDEVDIKVGKNVVLTSSTSKVTMRTSDPLTIPKPEIKIGDNAYKAIIAKDKMQKSMRWLGSFWSSSMGYNDVLQIHQESELIYFLIYATGTFGTVVMDCKQKNKDDVNSIFLAPQSIGLIQSIASGSTETIKWANAERGIALKTDSDMLYIPYYSPNKPLDLYSRYHEKYGSAVPSIAIPIDKQLLLSHLKCVSVNVNKDFPAAKFSFKSNVLEIFAHSERGESNTEIVIDYRGPDIEMHLHVPSLMHSIGTLDKSIGQVCIRMNEDIKDGRSPFYITGVDTNQFCFMFAPYNI